MSEQPAPVKCDKCGSRQVAIRESGFGVGRAVCIALFGSMVIGFLTQGLTQGEVYNPVVITVLMCFIGLYAGLEAKSALRLVCIACGHRWQLYPPMPKK